MIECRTTDIPEFQNYEYYNRERWVIRLFYLWIYLLLLLFQITWTVKVFDNISKFSKLSNFENFMIFQIKKITNLNLTISLKKINS